MLKEYRLQLMCDGENILYPTSIIARSPEEALGEAIQRLESVKSAIEYQKHG